MYFENILELSTHKHDKGICDHWNEILSVGKH